MQGLQFILLGSLRGSVAPVAIEAAVAQALLDIDPLLAMPLELAEAAEAFFAQVGVVALEQLGAHSAVLPAVEWAQLAAPRARTAFWQAPSWQTSADCTVLANREACDAHAQSENMERTLLQICVTPVGPY